MQAQTEITTGENGTFRGFVADEAVFGAYAQDKIWSAEVLHFFHPMIDAFAANGTPATYLDAGANIGLTLIPFLKTGKLSDAIAIEADADNAALLQENLGLNKVSARVIQKAVHDAHGTLAFERDAKNFGDHRLQGDGLGEMGEAARQSHMVEAAPLSALVGKIEGPLLIKTDLQGAEPAMFRGGEAVLAKAHAVLIEYWPYGMARLGEDEDAFCAHIAKLFRFGALLWPHAPSEPPNWRPLDEIFAEIDQVFDGDSVLHRTGCLNLALSNEPRP